MFRCGDQFTVPRAANFRVVDFFSTHWYIFAVLDNRREDFVHKRKMASPKFPGRINPSYITACSDYRKELP